MFLFVFPLSQLLKKHWQHWWLVLDSQQHSQLPYYLILTTGFSILNSLTTLYVWQPTLFYINPTTLSTDATNNRSKTTKSFLIVEASHPGSQHFKTSKNTWRNQFSRPKVGQQTSIFPRNLYFWFCRIWTFPKLLRGGTIQGLSSRTLFITWLRAKITRINWTSWLTHGLIMSKSVMIDSNCSGSQSVQTVYSRS